MNTKDSPITRRDDLLKEINAAGTWNQVKYDELQELQKKVEALPPEPDPEPRLDLRREVRPKKGR